VAGKVWIGTDTRFTIQLEEGSHVNVRHQNVRLDDPLIRLGAGDRVYLSWQKMAARVLIS
jgi:hypothetical protein